MNDPTLLAAAERLALLFHGGDAALGRPWAWGPYDEEGVRFALLRAAEELRALAVHTAAERAAGRPASQAQRILAQYHASYRELQAILLGLDDAAADVEPAPGEWPVRTAVAHIVGGEAAFYAAVRYAAEQYAAGVADPGPPDEPYYDALLGTVEEFRAREAAPLAGLRTWHAEIHDRILADLAGIPDDVLDRPSRYWEPEPYPLRFRLHRFESHLRQHTVQVEQTLAAIGRAPGEAMRLIRLLYAALADAEGAAIGAPEAAGRAAEVAAALEALADEVAPVLQSA